MKLKNLLLPATLFLVLTSCGGKTKYTITQVEKERIAIDERYDANPDAEAMQFVAPYKAKIDSIMGVVVGKCQKVLEKQKPEGTLSNLLADILVDAGGDYGEKPVMAFYNMGGIRTNSMPEGNVTWGDILAVAPFDNKITFLTLTGENLMELFANIAQRGGEGVSKGIALKISPNGKLIEASFEGKPIDLKAEYRVAAVDYIAEGNDGLVAFNKKTNFVAPKAETDNLRFVIRRYFEKMNKAGILVDANMEGRIVIVK